MAKAKFAEQTFQAVLDINATFWGIGHPGQTPDDEGYLNGAHYKAYYHQPPDDTIEFDYIYAGELVYAIDVVYCRDRFFDFDLKHSW